MSLSRCVGNMADVQEHRRSPQANLYLLPVCWNHAGGMSIISGCRSLNPKICITLNAGVCDLVSAILKMRVSPRLTHPLSSIGVPNGSVKYWEKSLGPARSPLSPRYPILLTAGQNCYSVLVLGNAGM